MMVHTHNPSTSSSKINLGYKEKPYLKKKKSNIQTKSKGSCKQRGTHIISEKIDKRQVTDNGTAITGILGSNSIT